MRPTFWITNISKRLISVGDLGILLQPRQSVNLLDSRHYSLTKEQIESSIKSGSIARMGDKIIVRKSPPKNDPFLGPALPEKDESDFPTKVRSILEFKEFDYEELRISDDEYATENAELAEEDDLGRFKKG